MSIEVMFHEFNRFSKFSVSLRHILSSRSSVVVWLRVLGKLEDCGENNMYWWSDSLSYHRECRWGLCTVHCNSYIQDENEQQ